VRGFFEGHACESRVWTAGPMHELHPGFHVLEIAPGPKSTLWSYVSVGGAVISQADVPALEFVLFADAPDPRHVEIVTMTAHFNHLHILGSGHTIPIGDPWLPGSSCDHVLIAKPYPLDSEFERVDAPEGHAHMLWLLPITDAERRYKIANGIDALEARFEEKALEYWRADRASTC